jgi:hypothetical protein
MHLENTHFLRRGPERSPNLRHFYNRTSRTGLATGELRVNTSRLTLVLVLALAGVPNRPPR